MTEECPEGMKMLEGRCVPKNIKLYNATVNVDCDETIFLLAKSKKDAERILKENGLLADEVTHHLGQTTCGFHSVEEIKTVTKKELEEANRHTDSWLGIRWSKT